MDRYIRYSISTTYTDAPGGRYKKDGKYSGEEFREKVLENLIDQSIKENKEILIDLDGVYGYATSFLDEAFGKLASKYKTLNLRDIMKFQSEDLPGLEEQIYKYMEEHKNEQS